MAANDTRDRPAPPSGGASPRASAGLVWARRASVLLLLIIGWVFILANNHFHLTASSFFIGLGYTAAVAAVYTLFRTGATAVATSAEDLGTAEWGAPMGPRGELEREKRMLLKAIREAEFDHEMGKLSKADADLMIAQYRARAIAIIKQLDTAEGESASTRSSIEREIRARLELGSAKLKAKKTKGKAVAVKAGSEASTGSSKVEQKDPVAAVDPEDASSDDAEDDDADEEADDQAPAAAHEFSDSTAAPAEKPPEAKSASAPTPISNGAPKPAASGKQSSSNKSGKSGKGGKKAAKKESA